MEIIGFLGGFLLGAVIIWFILRVSSSKPALMLNNRIADLSQENNSLEKDLEVERNKTLELSTEVATLKETNKNLSQRQAENEKILIEKFENLANDILDRKSQKFTDQNEKNLSNLLGPLKEKIEKFEAKVEKSNKDSLQWNAALKQQIESLVTLNQRITKEAENLTKALTGDSKTQGDWGELQLEMLLEKAGLVKDVHFSTQSGFRDDNGLLKRPDLIVNLPDKRHLIIDSKVSLTAYERYISAADKTEKAIHLKSHVQSIKEKIKDLSGKKYHELHGINTPDYVMMFIPVEPAFFVAMEADNNLYLDALEKNIVLVTASTLLATMRTVSFIWTQEDQTKNVMLIAKQSGDLYDKFVGFTEDLIRVGTAMDKAKSEYKGAMNKLSTGTGNLVKRAEKIKMLGAKANKSLSSKLLAKADNELIENSNDHADNT